MAVPSQGQYLVLMALCLAGTAPLEVLGAGVYRRPRRLLRTLLPVLALFTVWDAIAFARGEWGYNAHFVTGLRVPGGLPVEELVFFVVVPLCALLTYEAVSARWASRFAATTSRYVASRLPPGRAGPRRRPSR